MLVVWLVARLGFGVCGTAWGYGEAGVVDGSIRTCGRPRLGREVEWMRRESQMMMEPCHVCLWDGWDGWVSVECDDVPDACVTTTTTAFT